jgi:hypothetical protein
VGIVSVAAGPFFPCSLCVSDVWVWVGGVLGGLCVGWVGGGGWGGACSNLRELLDKFRATSGQTDEGAHVMTVEVLTSATDLFFYYKESLARMVKVSTKKAFVELTGVFGKYLRAYCEFLQSMLPRCGAAFQGAWRLSMAREREGGVGVGGRGAAWPALSDTWSTSSMPVVYVFVSLSLRLLTCCLLYSPSPSVLFGLGGVGHRDDAKNVSEQELRVACHVLNTADYCGDTTTQVRASRTLLGRRPRPWALGACIMADWGFSFSRFFSRCVPLSVSVTLSPSSLPLLLSFSLFLCVAHCTCGCSWRVS